MINKKVGNWVLKGYKGYKGTNNKSKYWVYNLPFYETMLEFGDLSKAKEYFNKIIKEVFKNEKTQFRIWKKI